MYLDSAILVKLLTEEPDSYHYASLVEGERVASSALAYTEVWSAILAKERAGFIDSEERSLAWQSFSQRVEEELITLVPLSDSIFKKANRILEDMHPGVALRTLDALHLATC